MDHLPDFVRLGKWHSTYDSGNAPLMFDVCSAVNKAGGLFTDHIVPADAHRTATFFDTWKARAMQADGVIVCFTDEYRQNFTALLKQEARVVLGLHHAKRIRLFVLDPSAGHTAALSLLQGEMGEWNGVQTLQRNVTVTCSILWARK